jgi:predicted deacylase
MIPNIETIPLRQMASGDVLSLQVYKFIGATPGKKVYIQSNLHGAEIAGNAVIYQLLEFLMSLRTTDLEGEIWLVPVCNPMGTNERTHFFSTGRYCAYERRDWNRIFWDYEKEAENLAAFAKSQLTSSIEVVRLNYLNIIQQQFKKLLEKINSSSSVVYSERFRYKLQSLAIDAAYLIDLHTSTNEGLNYLYYFRNRENTAKYFLLDFGILLDEFDGDAFDEAFIKPWLALENCFKSLGREIRFDVEAYTLELGTGMHIYPDSVSKGFQGVKNYLVEKGVLYIPDFSQETTTCQETTFYSKSKIKKYHAPAGGIIPYRVDLGSFVKAGDRVYQLLSFNKSGDLPQVIEVRAEEDGFVYDLAINQGVNEGEYVLGIIGSNAVK